MTAGTGSLCFWKALSKLYLDSRLQRCWVHKVTNVLNKLPKSLQPVAKKKLHNIWHADGKKIERFFGDFIQVYGAKFPKASQRLEKDHDALLTFYDFPAEHWRQIRTTNPIESTFGTAEGYRQPRQGAVFSSYTVITMAFKLCQNTEKNGCACIALSA
ncbi:MAG: hypothetical protein GY874_20765 [Desulfobacteraceae bacterium]|nr:hypothetical protein [Desulfobacteraceae bacterium]